MKDEVPILGDDQASKSIDPKGSGVGSARAISLKFTLIRGWFSGDIVG